MWWWRKWRSVERCGRQDRIVEGILMFVGKERHGEGGGDGRRIKMRKTGQQEQGKERVIKG